MKTKKLVSLRLALPDSDPAVCILLTAIILEISVRLDVTRLFATQHQPTVFLCFLSGADL